MPKPGGSLSLIIRLLLQSSIILGKITAGQHMSNLLTALKHLNQLKVTLDCPCASLAFFCCIGWYIYIRFLPFPDF